MTSQQVPNDSMATPQGTAAEEELLPTRPSTSRGWPTKQGNFLTQQQCSATTNVDVAVEEKVSADGILNSPAYWKKPTPPFSVTRTFQGPPTRFRDDLNHIEQRIRHRQHQNELFRAACSKNAAAAAALHAPDMEYQRMVSLLNEVERFHSNPSCNRPSPKTAAPFAAAAAVEDVPPPVVRPDQTAASAVVFARSSLSPDQYRRLLSDTAPTSTDHTTTAPTGGENRLKALLRVLHERQVGLSSEADPQQQGGGGGGGGQQPQQGEAGGIPASPAIPVHRGAAPRALQARSEIASLHLFAADVHNRAPALTTLVLQSMRRSNQQAPGGDAPPSSPAGQRVEGDNGSPPPLAVGDRLVIVRQSPNRSAGTPSTALPRFSSSSPLSVRRRLFLSHG